MPLRFGAIALGLLLIVSSASAVGAEARTSRATPLPISVSGLSPNGHLRCTAEFVPDLQPGEDVSVAMWLKNVTNKKVKVLDGKGRLRISQNGTHVWTTGATPAIGSPYGLSMHIGPHHERKLDVYNTPVRWDGTLQIQPICGSSHVPLRAVSMHVAVPGARPTAGEAIAAAAGRMSGVFDDCLPGTFPPGVDGSFAVPRPGYHLPPLQMFCWARVRHEAGFDIADLYFVSPAGAPPVELDLFNFASSPDWPKNKPMEAGHWEFVVTNSLTRTIGTATRYQTPERRGHSQFSFEHAEGPWFAQRSKCGGGGDAYGSGLYIELVWMNRCLRAWGTAR